MQQPVAPPHQLTPEEREAQRQEQVKRNQALIALLDTLEDEDPDEQRATWAAVQRALDEDRPLQRKLFP